MSMLYIRDKLVYPVIRHSLCEPVWQVPSCGTNDSVAVLLILVLLRQYSELE